MYYVGTLKVIGIGINGGHKQVMEKHNGVLEFDMLVVPDSTCATLGKVRDSFL